MASPKNTEARTLDRATALENGREVTIIASAGDLILEVEHSHVQCASANSQHCESRLFRVDSATLRKASVYFDRLLDPEGFQEGRRFADQKARLARNNTLRIDDVPRLSIQDLGPIGTVKSIQTLMTDFLDVLHAVKLAARQSPAITQDNSTLTLPVKLPKPSVQSSIGQLVRLCIVADRFEALHALRHYRKHQGYRISIDTRVPTKQPEERMRQRLLAHVLLQEDAESVRNFTLALVLEGPTARVAASDNGLWWHIPGGIEEELAVRRRYVLDTIQSIQTHFLALYSSGRIQQCRLGYNTSPECDMYQFGQMVRFLQKTGTLRLAGTLVEGEQQQSQSQGAERDPASPSVMAGDVNVLIDTLRSCPDYQLDHHTHCGLRTRFLPALDLLQSYLPDVGLCLDCWSTAKSTYSWTRAQIPIGISPKARAGNGRLKIACHEQYHDATRDLFMARERLWT